MASIERQCCSFFIEDATKILTDISNNVLSNSKALTITLLQRGTLLGYIEETHTHTRLMAHFPGLPRWAGTRKVKPIRILLKQETEGEWQWHPLSHMQVCTLLQTDNHTSTPPLSFTGRMPFLPPNQQHQSTEGRRLGDFSAKIQIMLCIKIHKWLTTKSQQ